ncbi:DsbA family protein [Rothia kristinae]|uniref:DsbA family protein n=1 Tax=Rothia kristinae TaxID=37923 RepID=UPI00244895B8|nr:thioredoxin domain-containing protein [Rothia kristinae]WGH09050.1 thioredoxin domain-containing protein [Rothia kristinae]
MSPSSTQRTSDARERARQIAARQARSANANRRWLQAAVIAVLVVIIAVIAIVYTQTRSTDVPDAGPVPSSANQYGGIVLTKDGIVKNSSDEASRDVNDLQTSTVSASASDGQSATLPLGLPTAEEAKKNGKPVRLTMFQDYNCLHCAEFEKAYGEDIKKKVLDGEIELEVRNLNFLDAETTTEYSSRAAVAAYAVAEQVSTEKFLDWQAEMFSHQGQGGLKNSEIEDIASKYGADIKSAMDSMDYRPMVNVTVEESRQNGIQGTPTNYVDSTETPSTDFASALDEAIKAKKES